MLGRMLQRGVGLLGLAGLAACHGGVTLNAIVLLVTLCIFVATILVDRS